MALVALWRPHFHPMSKDGLRPAWAFSFGKSVKTPLMKFVI